MPNIQHAAINSDQNPQPVVTLPPAAGAAANSPAVSKVRENPESPAALRRNPQSDVCKYSRSRRQAETDQDHRPVACCHCDVGSGVSGWGSSSRGDNTNTHEIKRRLIKADEITRADPDELFVLFRG